MRLLERCTQTRNTTSLSSELLVRHNIGPLDRFLFNGHRGSVVSKKKQFHCPLLAFLGVYEPDSAVVSPLQLTSGI